MTTRVDWVEELLASDNDIMGVYIALIFLDIGYAYSDIPRASGYEIVRDLRDAYSRFIRLGLDYTRSFNAAARFVDRLLEIYGVDNLNKRDLRVRLLRDVHDVYFRRFLDSYVKFLDPTIVDSSRRDILVSILKDIMLEAVKVSRYPTGAVMIRPYTLEAHARGAYKLDDDTIKRLTGEMIASNIVIFRYLGDLIIPTVIFTPEALDLIRSGRRVEVPRVEVTIKPEVTVKLGVIQPLRLIVPDRFRVRPSCEILESIVADVLGSLGFAVRTDVKLASRVGAPVEVDVWGERRVGNVKFTVYVSC
ncbi:MAG: hypothetical protein ACP5N5_06250, partial [Desulfurococcus sp.]|uniref:hypothetical protein n=1 Tax=Desulfurococcus sp. TaxID=51678 RepID=UPI003D0D89BC